ncbi:DUF1652 domain-containing protein [Falsiroseomonas sp.]|uniref:DUF1652 domain-containing protein n=1 Tax=Falsiroseomonas sp. TaxID=2870721 RepID=UPI0034A22BA7
MLSPQDIKARLEVAFAPLRCVVEIWDYEHRLRFKIFGKDGRGLVEMPDIIIRDVSDESQLASLIAQVRERLPQT